MTTWTYDQFGQELTRILPAVTGQPAAVETMTYNGFGQMVTHADFKAQVTKFYYDTDPGHADPQNPTLRLGRLTGEEYYVSASASTPAETVQYRYSAEGNREEVIDSVAGTTDYRYDSEQRLARMVGPAGLAQTINYAYDPATGQQVRMWTDQSEVQYGYDPLSRLQTVTLTKRNGAALANPEQTAYGFDEAGNLTGITQLVGPTIVLTSSMGYDALNRLSSRVNRDGAGNTLSSFNYTRTIDGQITGLVETVKQPGGTMVTTTTAYTYDPLNRLSREQVDTVGTANDYTTDYTLDLVGNRIRMATTTGTGAVERVEGTFDARDRLTQEQVYNAASGGTLTNTVNFGYDANGSLTSQIDTTGNSLTEVWDVRGRLQSASNVQGGTISQVLYRYDPDGIRMGTKVTITTAGGTTNDLRLFVVDPQSLTGYPEVVEERSEHGLILASYVYGNALEPISTAQTGQQVGIYLADGHSGVRQVVDLAGTAVLVAYRYDAFGNTVASAGSFSNQVSYRGERFDPVLGHYYFRARMYDPRTGRFAALDPLREQAPDNNLYRYASGNPVSFCDPSGLFELGEVLVTIDDGMAEETALAEPAQMYYLSLAVNTSITIKIVSTALLTMIAVTPIAVLLPLVITPAPPPTTSSSCGCAPMYLYGPLDGMGRSTGAYARFSRAQLAPVGKYAEFTGFPSWWNATNLPTPPGYKLNDWWRRGHLIGSKLGGAGGTQYENMTPLLNKINSPWMYHLIEKEVAGYAQAGFCIDYLAVPQDYGSRYFPETLGVVAFADNSLLGYEILPNDPALNT